MFDDGLKCRRRKFYGGERQTKVRLRKHRDVASKDVANFGGEAEGEVDREESCFVEVERETGRVGKVIEDLFELGGPVGGGICQNEGVIRVL